MTFRETTKQKLLTPLLVNFIHIMAYGGSRSGKTLKLLRSIIIRASKCPNSNHLIVRKSFKAVKRSIWLKAMPKVFEICFPDLHYHKNKTDYIYELPNNSWIWIGGLDDKERVEKILGQEYSTIYFNECSEIPYSSVAIALTRLAEKNFLQKKVYYDMNPPSKRHWSYKLFVRGVDPMTEEKVDQGVYASMIMNPYDNIENIDESYIKNVLDRLPLKEKNRFKEGLFQEDEDGVAYYEFDRDLHTRDLSNKEIEGSILIGVDFNVGIMGTVICKIENGIFYIIDESFGTKDTPALCSDLKEKGYAKGLVYPDSTGRNRKTSGLSDFMILENEGFNIQGTRNPYVTDRVNNVNRLFKENKIIIDKKCKKLIYDLESTRWVKNELDKKSDPEVTHITDALGYLTWAIDSMVYNDLKSEIIEL